MRGPTGPISGNSRSYTGTRIEMRSLTHSGKGPTFALRGVEIQLAGRNPGPGSNSLGSYFRNSEKIVSDSQ